MVQICNFNNSKLADAVIAWTGYGESAAPHRNDELLIEIFGANDAAKLILSIKELEKEFYLSRANVTEESLEKVISKSIDDFKNKYPDLPDKIGEVFAWCYTFDFK
jgi:hypothetical protein